MYYQIFIIWCEYNIILLTTELERLSLRKDIFAKILSFSPGTYIITVKLKQINSFNLSKIRLKFLRALKDNCPLISSIFGDCFLFQSLSLIQDYTKSLFENYITCRVLFILCSKQNILIFHLWNKYFMSE